MKDMTGYPRVFKVRCDLEELRNIMCCLGEDGYCLIFHHTFPVENFLGIELYFPLANSKDDVFYDLKFKYPEEVT